MREIELLSHSILPIYLPVRLDQDILNTDVVSVSHQVAGRQKDSSLWLPKKVKMCQQSPQSVADGVL